MSALLLSLYNKDRNLLNNEKGSQPMFIKNWILNRSLENCVLYRYSGHSLFVFTWFSTWSRKLICIFSLLDMHKNLNRVHEKIGFLCFCFSEIPWIYWFLCFMGQRLGYFEDLIIITGSDRDRNCVYFSKRICRKERTLGKLLGNCKMSRSESDYLSPHTVK